MKRNQKRLWKQSWLDLVSFLFFFFFEFIYHNGTRLSLSAHCSNIPLPLVFRPFMIPFYLFDSFVRPQARL